MRVTYRSLVRIVGGEEVATFLLEALPPRDPPLEVSTRTTVSYFESLSAG